MDNFLKDHSETKETKEKRIRAMTIAWKERKDYLGDKKYSYLYNCWRSMMFTNKGKKIGVENRWHDYKKFYEDMIQSYQEGSRIGRIDKDKLFSKDNCIWVTNEELCATKKNVPMIEFNGETKTLKEWSMIYEVPYSPLRQRFYTGKNLSPEEIIFGKKTGKRKKFQDQSTLDYQAKRSKASKMISSYRSKDSKKSLQCDLETEWFIENILQKPCYYCGSTEYVGADRIDNTKGHTINNVVPCCYICNVIKNNIFTTEEMLLLGKYARNIILNRKES